MFDGLPLFISFLLLFQNEVLKTSDVVNNFTRGEAQPKMSSVFLRAYKVISKNPLAKTTEKMLGLGVETSACL